jgi:hypothetical protein
MTPIHFCLHPFPGENAIARTGVTGSIGRSGNDLSLIYVLSGDISQVVIPVPSSSPERKDRLFGNTCFEFFMAPRSSSSYWEFNISPSGDWNVYHFADYRQGMREEQAFNTLPFRVARKADCLSLSLECELARIIGEDVPIEIAISAVVRTTEGQTSYWALKHSGPKPDFHRRDDFEVKL